MSQPDRQEVARALVIMRTSLGEWVCDDMLRRVFLAQCQLVEGLLELGRIEQAVGAIQVLAAGVRVVGPRAFGREDVSPGGDGA